MVLTHFTEMRDARASGGWTWKWNVTAPLYLILPSLAEKQGDAGRIFFADAEEEHKGGVLSDH